MDSFPRAEDTLVAQLLAQLLDAITTDARATLKELRCPASPVAIDDILAGRQSAPWPHRKAKGAPQRARSAMHTLVLADTVRRHAQRAPQAAYWAVYLGLYAGDRATQFLSMASRRTGGRQRGRQIAAKAQTRVNGHNIARLVRQWNDSDDLKDDYSYRSPVPYVRAQTGLDTRAAQRAVKALRTRQ